MVTMLGRWLRVGTTPYQAAPQAKDMILPTPPIHHPTRPACLLATELLSCAQRAGAVGTPGHSAGWRQAVRLQLGVGPHR